MARRRQERPTGIPAHNTWLMSRQERADDPKVEGADHPEPGHVGEPAGGLVHEGATRRLPRFVEYALLAALIALVSVVAFNLSGKESTKHFCGLASYMGPGPLDRCGQPLH